MTQKENCSEPGQLGASDKASDTARLWLEQEEASRIVSQLSGVRARHQSWLPGVFSLPPQRLFSQGPSASPRRHLEAFCPPAWAHGLLAPRPPSVCLSSSSSACPRLGSGVVTECFCLGSFPQAPVPDPTARPVSHSGHAAPVWALSARGSRVRRIGSLQGRCHRWKARSLPRRSPRVGPGCLAAAGRPSVRCPGPTEQVSSF